MANRWSHLHGKTSPEVVPFTWQPTSAGFHLGCCPLSSAFLQRLSVPLRRSTMRSSSCARRSQRSLAWGEDIIWKPEMAMRVEQCIFCGGDEDLDAGVTCGGCRREYAAGWIEPDAPPFTERQRARLRDLLRL